MNKNIFFILILVCSSFITFGQRCEGTKVAVILANGVRINENEITFDLYLRNAGSSEIIASAFGGGIIGLPKGIDGNFEVVQQPKDLSIKLNNLEPNFTPELGAEKMPILRWVNKPLFQEGITISSEPVKVAKLRFIRTGGVDLPAAVTLKWQVENQTPAQVVTYCNGNINPTTLTVPNEGLVIENLTIYNNGLSSTSETKVDGFSVSPNPTTDIIRVDISKLVGNKGDIEMQVVDAAGSVVMVRDLAKTATSHTISLATLTPAPYFVKLTQDGKTYTKSVIKLQQ